MIPDLREQIARDAPERLSGVARTALGEPEAVLGEWEAVSMQRAASSSLCRLTGTARVGADEHAWSVVLKVLEPAAGEQDPASIFYPRRELLLYQSGLLDGLAAGL